MMKKAMSGCFTLGLMGFLVVSWVAMTHAAEFSADIHHSTDSGPSVKGKVFVKGNRVRNEMMSGAERTVNIMDMDSKKVWVLMPEQKMFMEMQATGQMAVAGQKKEEIEKLADVKVLGTEKLEGYECEKIRYTYRDKSLGVMTQWLAKELNYPIKFVHEGPQGRTSMEYKNIRKGGVSDSLFAVPSDYQKMSIPGMGGAGPGAPIAGGDEEDEEDEGAPQGKGQRGGKARR